MRKPKVSKKYLEEYVELINERLQELNAGARKLEIRREGVLSGSQWLISTVVGDDPIWIDEYRGSGSACLAYLVAYYRGLLVERPSSLPV